MDSIESFLGKYEDNLDDIVFGGGWAIEMIQDRTHNPYRDHNDIDTLVLDGNLKLESDSHSVPGRYFYSIDMKDVNWLSDFIVEKQVVLNKKAYDVKVLCPEFIAVSKAFSRIGVARAKDNMDIRHIFQTIDLDKEKIYNLIENAKLLREESIFLDMMVEKGLETKKYSISDFNKKIFQEKFNIEKIPIHITSRILEAYDFLFSNIKKGLGAEWIKNNKKRIQEILNNIDVQKVDNYTFALGLSDALIQKVEDYGLGIKDALKYSKDSMKEGLVDKLLDIPNAQKARNYGSAIKNALEYSNDSMKEGLVDSLLSINYRAGFYGSGINNALKYAERDMKKDLADKIIKIPNPIDAPEYGYAIKIALEYAVDGTKKSLADRIRDIPDAQKAKMYGESIRNNLIHAEKDINTQQQIINNIKPD
ncbi:MAG: hypothetical protein KAS15_00390 [Nanoarchaeota archaeon]|nr:hypothetical protein [Nanoarchaeota archaeon]MCK5629604.1 hypothetical protein [Nanoarchaeota archaeon]